MNLLRTDKYKTKAVCVAAVPALRPSIVSLLGGFNVVDDINAADVLWVLDAGLWLDDKAVVDAIITAQRSGKPWMLLRLAVTDFFAADNKPKTTARRRVTLPR